MLSTITVPVLLIYGEEDQRAPAALAAQLHAAIPGSTLVVLPSAGHAVNVEAPEQFNVAVLQFLRTATAAPSRSVPR